MTFVFRNSSCLAVVWAASLCMLAGAAPPLAERLPGESCFALLTDNFAESAALFRKTNLGSLATSEDFGPLVREFEKRDQATLLHLRPWFGFDWQELSEVSGPGAIVVFPDARGQFGAACVVDATTSAAAKKDCLASGERYFLAKKFRKSIVQASDHELIIYEPPATRKGEPARVHFSSGNLFGAANTRAAAEALLATTAAGSLAKQPRFEQVMASSGASPGAARVFVRPLELWALGRAASEKAKPSSRDSFQMAKRQGLEGLQAVGGEIRFSHDKICDIDFSLTLLSKSPLKKAMELLAFKSGAPLDTPVWLAADTTSVTAWQWDFPAAMRAFGHLFDELNEPGPDGDGLFDDLLSGLRDDPEGPRVDLRRDLFARLGPQLMSVTDRRGKPTPQNPQGQRALYMAACNESPKVAALLKRFYEEDKLVTFEQLGDAQLWIAREGGSLFVEGDEESLIQPRAIAVAPGKLLFSSDSDYLRTALASKSPPETLANDGDWKQLREWLTTSGKDPAAFSAFVRLDQILEPAYRQLQTGKSRAKENWDETLLRFLVFGTTEQKVDQPYAALPDFERLRARLRPSGLHVLPTSHGQHLRGGIIGGTPRE